MCGAMQSKTAKESRCGSGRRQGKLLELAVLRLQAGFELFDGLASFDCRGTGDSANDTRDSGLFDPVQAGLSVGFHLGTRNGTESLYSETGIKPRSINGLRGFDHSLPATIPTQILQFL